VSLKVIENYKTKSGTHDFLLTFHCHHRPISHRLRDIGHFRRKSPLFPTQSIKRPRCPWNFVSAQGFQETRMMGLPDGRKSFQRGLAGV